MVTSGRMEIAHRERKGIRWLDCERDVSSRNESWS